MLKAALACFALAIGSFCLGATGLAGVSSEVGRVIVVAFLVPAVIGVSASVLANDRLDDVL